MLDKNSEMYRLSNFPPSSSSFLHIADSKTKTKKKFPRSSKYSSSFQKTTSICSYKNSIRKSDLLQTNYSKGNRLSAKKQKNKKRKPQTPIVSKNSFSRRQSSKVDHNLYLKNTRGTSLDDFQKKDKNSIFVSAIFIDDLDVNPLKNVPSMSDTYDRTVSLLSNYKQRCERLQREKSQYRKKYKNAMDQLKIMKKSSKKRK